MDKLKVSTSLVESLDNLRLNLTHFYLLFLSSCGRLSKELSPVNVQTLERKGYVTKDGIMTHEGRVLYDELNKGHQVEDIKKAIKKIDDSRKSDWERFYNAFPSGTTWYTEDGTKINGGSSLKTPSKAECEPKFYEMMEYAEQQGHTIDDVIDALEYEVKQRKVESLATGENKMQFMKRMGGYLNGNMYEPWIEMAREEKAQMEKKKDRPQTIDTSQYF